MKMKKMYGLLLFLIILSSCATVPMTSRPLKKNELALGLTFHFSPERKNEAATGLWFGYGIGNDVDVFFDLTTIIYPYYIYTDLKKDNPNFAIPTLTIRKKYYVKENLYYFGLSSFSGIVEGDIAFTNIGTFCGMQLNHRDLSFNESLFIGYQRKGYIDNKIYGNGYIVALKNSISSNKSLFQKEKDLFQTFELSFVPEFWIDKNCISFKDKIFQLNYEVIEY
jgi:hypothetical protein